MTLKEQAGCSWNSIFNKRRITLTDIFLQKGRKWKENRSPWSQAILKSCQTKSICFQGLGDVLWFPALPPGQQPTLKDTLAVQQKVTRASSWIIFMNLFLTCSFLGVPSTVFFLVPFSASARQYFCWLIFSRILWVSHVHHRDSPH